MSKVGLIILSYMIRIYYGSLNKSVFIRFSNLNAIFCQINYYKFLIYIIKDNQENLLLTNCGEAQIFIRLFWDCTWL